MLFQKELKALSLKGIVWGFWIFFFLFFFLLKEDPLIGVYVSFCMFWLEFLEKWIPEGERSPGNVTLHPTSFRMLMRIFLQTQICCCFSWGKKEMKTQCDRDTERKIAVVQSSISYHLSLGLFWVLCSSVLVLRHYYTFFAVFLALEVPTLLHSAKED